MTGPITQGLAGERTADRLREGVRFAEIGSRRARDEHERQRELVRASVLLLPAGGARRQRARA